MIRILEMEFNREEGTEVTVCLKNIHLFLRSLKCGASEMFDKLHFTKESVGLKNAFTPFSENLFPVPTPGLSSIATYS